MKPFFEGRRILPVFFGAMLLVVQGPTLALGMVFPPDSSSISPKIRVLLKESVSSVEVSGWDLEVRQAGPSKSRIRQVGRGSWRLSCAAGKVRVGSTPGKLLEGPVEVSSPSGTIFWSSKLIRESLTLHPLKSGCSVVNTLDIEKYLDGVVNGEFSAKWSAEAVSAQVIAARSYALYQSRQARSKNAYFDVEASTRDQVYLGTEGEEARASQIVAKTRGVVLASSVDEKGRRVQSTSLKDLKPIKAFYHSTCGGQTDSPEDIWGQPQMGVRGGVRCLHCGSSPRFRWELRVGASELDQVLSSYRKGRVTSVEVLSRFPSGRIRKLKLGFVDRSGRFSSAILPGAQFRSLLGAEKLRSTFFDVSRGPVNEWFFRGRGNGHGVGMCQWGAKEMGSDGFTAEQILTHYYPQSYLVRVWK